MLNQTIPDPYLILLLSSLNMPLHNLLEDTLSACLNDIAMTRHNAIKLPRVDLRNTLVIRGAVPRTDGIPNKPFLPNSIASGAINRTE